MDKGGSFEQDISYFVVPALRKKFGKEVADFVQKQWGYKRVPEKKLKPLKGKALKLYNGMAKSLLKEFKE